MPDMDFVHFYIPFFDHFYIDIYKKETEDIDLTLILSILLYTFTPPNYQAVCSNES